MIGEGLVSTAPSYFLKKTGTSLLFKRLIIKERQKLDQ